MKTAFKIEIHDCSRCALHKEYFDINVDVDDIKVYNRIQVMLDNSNQAVNTDSLSSLPDTITEKEKELYIKTAIKNNNNAKMLLSEWWMHMLDKYPELDASAKVDLESNRFYRCVNERGVGDLTGKFIEKK